MLLWRIRAKALSKLPVGVATGAQEQANIKRDG